MEIPSVVVPPVELKRCKIMFENLDIPSRYYMVGEEPYHDMRSKVKNEYHKHGLSRKMFLLLWIDVDGDEILLDSEESMAAALGCVPVDQSGYRILRILARHSTTVAVDGVASNSPEQTVGGKLIGEHSPMKGSKGARDMDRDSTPERSLQRQVSESRGETFPCEKCGRVFTRKSSRTAHAKKWCQAGTFSNSPDKNKPSASQAQASDRDTVNEGTGKNCSCDYCGKNFTRKSRRNDHVEKNVCGWQNRTGKRSDIPDKITDASAALIEEDESPEQADSARPAKEDTALACDYCGRTFGRKDSRNKHMKRNVCRMKKLSPPSSVAVDADEEEPDQREDSPEVLESPTAAKAVVDDLTCQFCRRVFARKDTRDNHVAKNTCGLKFTNGKGSDKGSRASAQSSYQPAQDHAQQDSSMENEETAATTGDAVSEKSTGNQTRPNSAKRQSVEKSLVNGHDESGAGGGPSGAKRRRSGHGYYGRSSKRSGPKEALCECGKIYSTSANLKRHQQTCEIARALQDGDN